MTRFHFERPDGSPPSNVQNISEHLNPFVPPQGFLVKGGVTFVASFDAATITPLSGALGVKFNTTNGTKLYLISFTTDLIYQYTVSPIFSMSPNPTFDSKTFDVSTEQDSPTDLAWSSVGNKLFVIGDINDEIHQYPVSTNFDVSTAGPVLGVSILTGLALATGLAFGDNGFKLYASDGGGIGKVVQYNLTTDYDIQSGVGPRIDSTITFPDTDIRGVAVSKSNDKLFVIGRTAPATVYQYSMVDGDITTLSTNPTATFDLTNEMTSPFGITLSDDETQMFIVDGNIVFQYALPSAFQL